MINWKTTKNEYDIITDIAHRAVAMAKHAGVDYDMRTALMDITAAHCNGNRLDLPGLLGADKANFVHDVFGIRRHLNRETGKLEDCFVPRFTLKSIGR